MKGLHMISWILLIIGGLNWLLIGIGGWNIVAYLPDMLARLVYILVGLGALVILFTHKRDCKMCGNSASPTPPAM